MPVITLPTPHVDQLAAYAQIDPRTGARPRFQVLRCGRRWGKTAYAILRTCPIVLRGGFVGFFAPDYKTITETYNEIAEILEPIKLQSGSRKDSVFRATTGGRIDYWSLDNKRAGRSRKYDLVVIDEAAFTDHDMLRMWQTAIRPTLLDRRGSALVCSNANGSSRENFLWRLCNEPEHGFVEYHAPTHRNPHLPADELEKLERENAPLVYRQEYLAEFVDWTGAQFFNIANCLFDGQPIDYPPRCDAVFATIDTGVKTGREHDGTAVCFWAINKIDGHPLILLDWDIIQIEGDLLITWLPTVFQRLEEFARQTRARYGNIGAYIEDKVTGMVLLQHAARNAWPVHSIDSKLTAMGKDERAVSISGYVHRNMVKLSRYAFDKTMTFKEQTRNHLLTQVFDYRVGVPQSSDDLLDAFCYGVAVSLGNAEGF